MLRNVLGVKGSRLSRHLQPVFVQLSSHPLRSCRRSHSTADGSTAGSRELLSNLVPDATLDQPSQGASDDRKALAALAHKEVRQQHRELSEPTSPFSDRRAARSSRKRHLRHHQLETDPGPDAKFRFWKVKTAPPDKVLATSTTSFLDNRLDQVSGDRADLLGTLRILRELIGNRGIRPTAAHYKALILSNVDGMSGSARNVRMLLEEMEANNIPADSPTLHAALRVLAVHPDFLLRQDVLRMLRNRWISLSPMGWHHIVVGLIRESQFEMTLHTISMMEAKNIQLREWVFDLLIYSLCNVEEFDMILDLIKSRMEWGGEVSPTLWFHLLDRASYAMHEPCVELCWTTRVETGLVNPAFGICDQVLRITARSGNVELANSVFRILKARNSPHSVDNYECLIETYLAANDLENAFQVLCRLSRTTMSAPESSTRAIMNRLISLNRPPQDYWALLKSIAKKSKLDVPSVVANLVFEYCAYRLTMTVAMNLFKDYHSLVPAGPDNETVNHCIAGCRAAMESTDEKIIEQAKLAGWYLQEMIDLKIMPNQRSYEEIILWCITGMKWEEAFNYFTEMLDSEFEISPRFAKTVRTTSFEVDDPYAKRLQTHAKLRKPFGKDLAWFDYRYGRQREKRSDETSITVRPIVYNPPPNYENKMLSERLRMRRDKKARDEALRKEVEAEFYEPYWYNDKAHERRRLRKEKGEADDAP
ncbi:hypothetical protein KEM56_005019 [Ascosphaera pollenicola]|nr:hypothetical protein KEM56_005019 [Ascosphaera pollenicola]